MTFYLMYYIMRNADFSRFPHSYQVVDSDLYKHTALTFEYEAEITSEVILDFAINEIGLGTYHKLWNDEQRYGFERAIKLMWEQHFFSQEQLENNEDFMSFIQDYFSGSALKQFESEVEDDYV